MVQKKMDLVELENQETDGDSILSRHNGLAKLVTFHLFIWSVVGVGDECMKFRDHTVLGYHSNNILSCLEIRAKFICCPDV
jgi:hypothetical protein